MILEHMSCSDCDRSTILSLREEKEQLLSAYNQLEHAVMLLKAEFESLQSSSAAETSEVQRALSALVDEEAACDAHELEIATLKILVQKIRAKAPREAPDGAEMPSLPVGNAAGSGNGLGNADNELLTSSVRNLKERCGALEAKNTAMKRDNDALRDQLMDRREKWDALEITNKNLAKEVSSRDGTLGQLKDEISNLMETIEQKDKVLSALERENKEITRLREHLMAVEEEHEQQLIKVQESEQRLQEQVEALRNGLDDVTGARNDLEEQHLGTDTNKYLF